MTKSLSILLRIIVGRLVAMVALLVLVVLGLIHNILHFSFSKVCAPTHSSLRSFGSQKLCVELELR